MTASKIYFYIYTVTVIPDCVPEKVAYLKEGAGTLVFQPHYTMNSCGALCTYSLYDKQVNGAGAWRTERFIKPFFALTP
jgi:hypothetical protein